MSNYERSGWRDQEISGRHRRWGFNCPAVDLDFVMVEYNLAKPVALVDYKLNRAARPNLKHPTYQALAWLAEQASIPFFLAWYWLPSWAVRVEPVTARAITLFPERDFSEVEYVTRLYELRHLAVDAWVLKRCNKDRPPEVDRGGPA